MIKDYIKKNYTIPQGLQQESQLFQAVLRKVKKKKKFFSWVKVHSLSISNLLLTWNILNSFVYTEHFLKTTCFYDQF